MSEALLGIIATVILAACGGAFFLARNHPRVCAQVMDFVRSLNSYLLATSATTAAVAWMTADAVKRLIGEPARVDAAVWPIMVAGLGLLAIAVTVHLIATAAERLAALFAREHARMSPPERVRGQGE